MVLPQKVIEDCISQLSFPVNDTWDQQLIQNKGLFASQFWRFQFIISWPCCFGVWEAAYDSGSHVVIKASHLMAGGKKEMKKQLGSYNEPKTSK
jgi:hypothetical protein